LSLWRWGVNVDEMTLDELRVAIAERLGYKWRRVDDDFMAFVAPDGRAVLSNKSGVIADWKSGDVSWPNWPTDDAAATDLLRDADRRGWYVFLDNDAGYEGDEGEPPIWNCCIAGGCCFGVKTLSEAVSRAWLKAMVAE
jgi:hypothetical protein